MSALKNSEQTGYVEVWRYEEASLQRRKQCVARAVSVTVLSKLEIFILPSSVHSYERCRGLGLSTNLYREDDRAIRLRSPITGAR